MKRKIRTYGGYFEAFMETLKEKEREKIQYGLLLLKSQDWLPKKFVNWYAMAFMNCEQNTAEISSVFSLSSTKEISLFSSTDSKKRLRKHQRMK